MCIPLAYGFILYDLAESIYQTTRALVTPSERIQKKCVVITGASSGIGAALAVAFASDPGVHLVLIARNVERLNKTARLCIEKGKLTPDDVETHSCSVMDMESLRNIFNNVQQRFPIDIVIANAGVTARMNLGDWTEYRSEGLKIIETNITGVVNTIWASIEHLVNQKHGQIVIMGSLSGFYGPPNSPFYNGTKAFMRTFARDLGAMLRDFNIDVTLLAPGFIESPLIEELKGSAWALSLPGMKMDLESSARAMKRSIDRKDRVYGLPWSVYSGTLMAAMLPPYHQYVMSRAVHCTGMWGDILT